MKLTSKQEEYLRKRVRALIAAYSKHITDVGLSLLPAPEEIMNGIVRGVFKLRKSYRPDNTPHLLNHEVSEIWNLDHLSGMKLIDEEASRPLYVVYEQFMDEVIFGTADIEVSECVIEANRRLRAKCAEICGVPVTDVPDMFDVAVVSRWG